MDARHRFSLLRFFLLSTLLAFGVFSASAGTFRGWEIHGVDGVTHPKGYDGTGGPLTLTVCLDPKTSDPQAELPLRLALMTWNHRLGTTGNLSSTAGVPEGSVDFPSVALRGLGLCLGLEDPSDAMGYTRAEVGGNGMLDLGSGADMVAGTADDVRNDDESLFFFAVADNLPFTEKTVVDSTTFSRDEAVLPEGDNFPACPTRAVALQLGFVGTEAVMVDNLQPGEAKRSLTWDDISIVRYGESGLDELAGTADDYRVTFAWAGVTDVCDLRVTFKSQGTIAACPGGLGNVAGNHSTANFLGFLAFDGDTNWYFDDQGVFFLDEFEGGNFGAWSTVVP